MDASDIIRRRVRRQIANMKTFGMTPDQMTIVDPLTGKSPESWERVEEILFEIRLKQQRSDDDDL